MSENMSDREYDNCRFSSMWISGHIRGLISDTSETQLHNSELMVEIERIQFQRENEKVVKEAVVFVEQMEIALQCNGNNITDQDILRTPGGSHTKQCTPMP
jgi:hypothetical protein